MSEQTMSEENKKTIVAFIAGLLIGGILVFIFANPGDKDAKNSTDRRTDETAKTAPDSVSGESSNEEVNRDQVSATGVTSVDNRPVADTAALNEIEFPAESGWVGVRDFENGQLTGLLGVARWNMAEGLTPTEVPLLRSMEKGRTYAIVFYKDNGDKHFDLATDSQMETSVISFVAE